MLYSTESRVFMFDFFKETLHGIGDLRISIKEGAQGIQLICSNAIETIYTLEELNA